MVRASNPLGLRWPSVECRRRGFDRPCAGSGQEVTRRPEPDDRLPQDGNLSLIGLLLPAPRKGSSGSNAQFAYPAQKHALGDIQITPRSVTTFAASILNARLNFRLVISSLRSKGHDLVFVSVKPPAADIFLRRCRGAWFSRDRIDS